MGRLSFGIAFIAGLASFLSPCVLPLVPAYIGFISGMSLEDLRKGGGKKAGLYHAGMGSVFFVLGFSFVFTLLGASATAAGQFLADHAPAIIKIAGVVIILFGLHTMELLPIRWLYYEKRIHPGTFSPGFGGAFLMGFAFAFGWTPCIGPILGGILALAATQSTVYRGMLLLFCYSLGLGIPFILTGLAVNRFLQFFARYKRFIRWGERFAGALLVAIGAVLLFTRNLTALARFLPSFLYKFSL
jgi:cytochrome c-type biogenesis protein